MRAATIHRYGGPEELRIEERPAPTLRQGDVLIDVRAASLNPIDFKLREKKTWPVVLPEFPLTLGCDVAGVIRDPGKSRFAKGDAVYARLEKNRMGALAEQVAADASVVAKKPERVSFEEAAAIPLTSLTALQALREAAKLQPGQRVLIHAGAGGLGTQAIQIAKILGLWVATTTSTKNVDFVRSLGADQVIDYTKEDPASVRDLDAVIDTLGDASEVKSLALVKRGGVVVGLSGLPTHTAPALPWFAKPVVWLRTGARRTAVAKTGARFEYVFMRPDGAMLGEIGQWVDTGKLRPILHRTYAFAEVKEAFAELERGRARGKIVVTI